MDLVELQPSDNIDSDKLKELTTLLTKMKTYSITYKEQGFTKLDEK